jgi:hypothetical protein
MTIDQRRIWNESAFGVRRQSGAATALWLTLYGPQVIKRCRTSFATALQIFGQDAFWWQDGIPPEAR